MLQYTYHLIRKHHAVLGRRGLFLRYCIHFISTCSFSKRSQYLINSIITYGFLSSSLGFCWKLRHAARAISVVPNLSVPYWFAEEGNDHHEPTFRRQVQECFTLHQLSYWNFGTFLSHLYLNRRQTWWITHFGESKHVVMIQSISDCNNVCHLSRLSEAQSYSGPLRKSSISGEMCAHWFNGGYSFVPRILRWKLS